MTVNFTTDWTHSLNNGKVVNQKLQKSHQNTVFNEKHAINNIERRTCQKNQTCCLRFCHFSPPPPTSVELGGPLLVPHHLNPPPPPPYGKCPGGALDFHVDGGGGVPLGVENLTLSQCARCTKITPCHNIPYYKCSYAYTLSQYCTVAGAQIAGLS